MELEGETVIQLVVDAVAASGLDEIVVVLGHAADEIESRLELSPIARVVRAEEYRLGQSASLKAGIDAVSAESSVAVVVLGDQPRIDPSSIRALIERFRQGAGPVVQASYEGTPGHPVLFDREVWKDLRGIEGDMGARDLLKQNPGWITRVDIEGPPPADLDTWEDYETLKNSRK